MPTKYIKKSQLSNGLIKAAVKIKKQDFWGLLDEKGETEVTPFQYEYMGEYDTNGFCKVRRDSLYGFLDSDGKELLPCKYQEIV